jgi:cyclopropane fatty-acyl-phospholipid synthase-like methyltransferase
MSASVASMHDQTLAHRIEWLNVDRCPACESPPQQTARLPESGYVFGDERIEFPSGGISIAHCSTCELAYKTVLPAPASLAQVFERQAGKKWMERYDFRDEVIELHRLMGGNPDLLDIGSGNGALLEAWAHQQANGRRSALDVVLHPGGASHINGEFIRGLIDSEVLRWNREPYDIVTLFDVVEHLYAPQIAFRNLRALVRDHGLVVIESGNVASDWPQRYGTHHWWYARLFEHHIFWSRRAIERIAERFGFRLLLWRDLRHKARTALPLHQKLNDAAQVALYKMAPRLYPRLAPLLGKYWTQPWSPFTCDHFRVVLRKQ